MAKILGIIDEDPFDYRTWSGSSKYFFESLVKQGALAGAISAQPRNLKQRLHQLQSFHFNMDKWKFAYHLNTNFYSAMSEVAKAKISKLDIDYDTILQVGAWYDLVTDDKLNVSYHDGNLATRLASPFGYPKISKNLVRKALAYEKSLYDRLDLIFPMSQWLADSFQRDFQIPANKIVPVGAGINLPRVLDTQNRTYNEKKILYVGKDFTRKGGDYLLKAFNIVRKEIPDAELRIIGPVLEAIPDGVKCLGFIPKYNDDGLDMLLEEYSNARVFVIPSLYEPFGISFVEAMAHRVPCIGTNICAMPEIIKDGITGFVVPTANEIILADRILQVLKSEEMCIEMGNAGYDHYRTNYTWDIVTSKILSAINLI